MLLNLVIWIPLAAFVIGLLLPKNNTQLVRLYTLGVSTLTFLLSLALLAMPKDFSYGSNLPWIDTPNIRYHVGLDGVSLWLVLLTTLLTPICVLISWNYITKRIKEFYIFLLLLEFGLVGVFCALDLFLFFVFWEVSLVPMYFLIGVWGYDRRIYAAVKFFIFTMVGSMMMLVAIIYVYGRTGTFDYLTIMDKLQHGTAGFAGVEQLLLFLGFFLAFAIKVPLWPLHTWLPDAHVEAPTAGSVMLASVMLKMGTYGLLRFCIPMFPTAARTCAPWIVVLAIIGIIYGALVAMVQPNMKKLVAYSSVSHLGFVVLGLFSFTQQGFDGAVYQMLNHGISTGALFILVGFMYERRHSLEIAAYGGVGTPAPNLAVVFAITMLASIGLPTLNNFVGEFLVLQGAAVAQFKWAVFAAIGVILSACYMLWLYQRTFMGKASDEVAHHMYDLKVREWACMVPLILLMVWLGSYAQTFLPSISASNASMLNQSKNTMEMHVRNHGPRTVSVAELIHAR
ncbi:MAG TPA: NADH-quinone oxidoreductase subunit M [Bryobacteraceae bacterium]|nr:NADH-quinone oxidoreductase subunit M [Bryobacteraceae bacterium]